ncbi:DUF1579 domain-containing protein [bacterium]|nr:DUF1579 domain-containing protein [bacterium]
MMTIPPDDEKPADTPDFGDHDNLPTEELRRLWRQFNRISAKSPEHARLLGFVGRWSLDGGFDACGYGPHFDAKGQVACETIFDGRFVQMNWRIESELTNWELQYQLGYDNVIGKYTLSMIESIHNGTLLAEGGWYDTDGSIRLWGEYSNPMFKTRHDCLVVFRFLTPDRILTAMHVPDREGKFMETLHIEMRRTQKPPLT